MQFLTFQLFAPLAAMGREACGEIRPSAKIPRTSQLVGLFGCCLGIGRDRRQDLAAMADAMGLCVMAVNPAAPPMLDYHTIQIPAEGKDLTPLFTRADELAAYTRQNRRRPPSMRPYPITSRRGYVQNAPFVVAVWPTGPATPGLEDLANAMRRPRWIPFFGRKSCALAVPLAPRIEEHDTPVAALRAYPLDAHLRRDWGGRYYPDNRPQFWLRETLLDAFAFTADDEHGSTLAGWSLPTGQGRNFREETWRRINA
ncbi:type I-E CRISPR-associated protein Cas5/CasD [Solidesulfovibrio sp. C21]|uniref:type I-E CRISPR-associated protein Cas5/CasD n=1 Tax=Solidesulfovibrio sp. C21 TaxID=3398613 RepID=UPI0039FCA44C